MTEWKMPPKAKVYEALGAVLDKRVRVLDAGRAEVSSSGGDKVYKVRWVPGSSEITSTDPASRFQGYVGYPIIAVLLATDRLKFDPEIAEPLKGVIWKELNDRYKRDYGAAVSSVLDTAIEADKLREMVDRIYEELQALSLVKWGSRS